MPTELAAGQVIWILPQREAAAAQQQAEAADASSQQQEGDPPRSSVQAPAPPGVPRQQAAEAAAWPSGKAGRCVAREVDREVFSRILLTLDMVKDHLPDAHLSAIQQLRWA